MGDWHNGPWSQGSQPRPEHPPAHSSHPVRGNEPLDGMVLHIPIGRHTVGYALLFICAVIALLAFFLMPFVTFPFFAGISLTAWQSVTFTNPLTGEGPHSNVDVLATHYGPLLFSLALLAFATMLEVVLAAYDRGPSRDWVLNVLAGIVAASAVASAAIIIVLLWPFSIPVEDLQFLGAGYWALYVDAFLVAISATLIVVP